MKAGKAIILIIKEIKAVIKKIIIIKRQIKAVIIKIITRRILIKVAQLIKTRIVYKVISSKRH